MVKLMDLFNRNKTEVMYPTEMTAKELDALMWGPETLDKNDQSSRKIRNDVVLASIPTRYVPLSVLETAEKYSHDPLKVSDYIHSAFCIYRGSVCNQLTAPHVFKDKILEWPEPVDFSWSDGEAVLTGGKFVFTGLEGKVEISTEEGDYKRVVEIDAKTNEKKEKIKKLGIGDKLGSTMKFKMPGVHNVGLIAMYPWQISSLRWYANYLGCLRDDLGKGVPVEEKRIQDLSQLMKDLREPVELPVIYLKKGDRKENEYEPNFLAWFNWCG